jgi:hypothetical protein
METLIRTRIFGYTWKQIKRFVIYNSITAPVSTVIYLPYNLLVLGYSTHQIVVWALTGAEYGAMVALVMTWVNIFAVRMADKWVK